jgi:hypothetical protein
MHGQQNKKSYKKCNQYAQILQFLPEIHHEVIRDLKENPLQQDE